MLPLALLLIAGNTAFADETPSFQLNTSVVKAITRSSAEQDARWNMVPKVTRAGFYRFLGSDLESPQWTDFYIKRFIEKEEPQPVKLALLDLILRSGGDWSTSMYNHIQKETDPAVRALIIDMTKRLTAEEAIPFIDFATSDESDRVRAAAMRALGNHLSINRSAVLIEALTDPSVDVRLMAIRTLGWSKDTNAIPGLVTLLAEKNNTIRLKSLYALNKIDQEVAKKHVEQLRLVSDFNPQISRLAKKIQSK
jgi:HEAT repeat protein